VGKVFKYPLGAKGAKWIKTADEAASTRLGLEGDDIFVHKPVGVGKQWQSWVDKLKMCEDVRGKVRCVIHSPTAMSTVMNVEDFEKDEDEDEKMDMDMGQSNEDEGSGIDPP